jgi:hypothetical protein
MKKLTVIPIAIFALMLPVTISYGVEKVDNLYFSLNVPESWPYAEYSNTGMASLLGRGPVNLVVTAPSNFSHIITETEDDRSVYEKLLDGGAYGDFRQDTDYSIKNAPLETYAKHIANDNYLGWNITSQQDSTVGKQKAMKISYTGFDEYKKIKVLQYLVFHDKQPYLIEYIANVNDYDKYLTDFEAMVKSFRFEN